MVSCDVTLTTAVEQGATGAIVAWFYQDDSDGSIVIPVSFNASLFDPSDVQRLPSDTSQTTSIQFTPTIDTDGSVTGTINKVYATINFDGGAPLGTWYVQTTYTHESVTRTRNICFIVVSAGASVGSGVTAGTVPVYAIAKDVENFLILQGTLDNNSTPNSSVIDSYIMMAEGEFESRSGTAYKPVMAEDEVHDIEAMRSRHRDFLDETGIIVPRPIHLKHRPLVMPFDQARGCKIEVYEGSDTTETAADPMPRWTDWLNKTQGRDNDYWFDWQKGHMYIRKTFVFRRAQAVRVTYEYGKAITTTTGAISASPSVINVVSTHGYQARGIIRIGNTYYHHTSKTQTSFTGVTVGVYDTQGQVYQSGSEVYEVPEQVRRLVTMRAAAMYLQNENFVAAIGDNAGTSPAFSDKIRAWNEEWERGMASWQKWTTF